MDRKIRMTIIGAGSIGGGQISQGLSRTRPSDYSVDGPRRHFRPVHPVARTVKGAAALLEAHGSHPEAEIDKVTTPGGLTISGLNAMEEAGFSSAVIRGLMANKSNQAK